ncbi:MAG: class B sortase [Oscillospiraceae bacterium]|nr:class B sortase [Oscillospiraceae bacterium]
MKSFGHILRQALLVILCGIFLGIFIFAAHELYYTLHGYHAAEKAYESLSQQYVSTQTAAEVTPEPTPKETEKVEETAPPVVSGDINVDFAALQAVNPQVVGWIYSPNTVISYPVLKGADNDYYLSHLYDGTVSANGSIFMDCVCESDLNQDNTILYGHHMNNGSMFASINNYIYEGYLEEHPVLYYYTPDGNYALQVFACFVTGGDSDVYAFNFATRDQFQSFIDRMRSRSNFDAPDVSVTSSDRIMTLSTCAYDYDDARYVVLCKIVPM